MILIPILVSSAFVLAVIALCYFKPNPGRIFLGFFFFVMVLGVNGSFTFGNPQAYLDYAGWALVPFYRNLAIYVMSINPVIFSLLLMAFEIHMGLLLLSRGKSVKIHLAGRILFVASISPLSWMQIPGLGLIIAEVDMYRKDFARSLLDMVQQKIQKGVANV